jgi:hypothetical protein
VHGDITVALVKGLGIVTQDTAIAKQRFAAEVKCHKEAGGLKTIGKEGGQACKEAV